VWGNRPQIDDGQKLEEDEMNFNETRRMAKGMGINTHRLKKPDIIRAIQRAEFNLECFGTERVEYCNEDLCLWRHDCLWSKNYALSDR